MKPGSANKACKKDLFFLMHLCTQQCQRCVLYITGVDVLCTCGVYCTSVRPREGEPSSVALLQGSSLSQKGFYVFPDPVRGSKDGGCHNCAACKADFGL